MKVDYLSIHFKTFMIPSRTKLESFDSFGSHAQLLPFFMVNFHIFFECNEPILYFFCSYSNKIGNESIIQGRNIWRTLLTKQKICNCQQNCFFFSNKKFLILYIYFINRSSTQHLAFKQKCKKKRKKDEPLSNTNKGFKSFYRYECYISRNF